MRMIRGLVLSWIFGLGIQGCGYNYYTGPLQPGEHSKRLRMSVADDGTVTFEQDRFEVRLKPMTDEELNRQFFNNSQSDPSPPTPIPLATRSFGARIKKNSALRFSR